MLCFRAVGESDGISVSEGMLSSPGVIISIIACIYLMYRSRNKSMHGIRLIRDCVTRVRTSPRARRTKATIPFPVIDSRTFPPPSPPPPQPPRRPNVKPPKPPNQPSTTCRDDSTSASSPHPPPPSTPPPGYHRDPFVEISLDSSSEETYRKHPTQNY